MKQHYYPDSNSDQNNTTACGRDGRKTGGLIGYFFQISRQEEHCKICQKRFEKDQKKA